MERNVLSWGIALENGYEPSDYPFKPEGIEAGEYDAMLDFKIWAKNTMAVVCYFTLKEPGKKCCLSVFRLEDKSYRLRNADMDFTTCPTGQLYRIAIGYNGKGKPVLKEAALL